MPKMKLINPLDVKQNEAYRLAVHPDIVAQLVELGYGSRKYWTDQATELIIEGLKSRGHWPIPSIEDRLKRASEAERDKIPLLKSKPDTSEPS